MLKQKNYPKIIFHDGVTYSDLSLSLLSFGRDSATVPLEAAAGALYFGRYKPFDALFVEMATVNAVSTTLTAEYWNGSAWSTLENAVDDTKAFSRSGFIQFDKPADWEETSVNSEAAYWIRFRPALDVTPAMAIQGMNLVFSDDQDLNTIYPGVSAYLTGGENSFILRHENSRDLIVQEIRNHHRKYPIGTGRAEMVDHWDFMHIEEVQLWATFLTMANIFSSLQSNGSDLYKEKADEYRKMAEQYKNSFFLTIDKNDDGLVSAAESAASFKTITLVRG